MKKWLFLALLTPAVLLLGGCQEPLLENLDSYISELNAAGEETAASPSSTPTPTMQPVPTQIDELSGTLMAFDGRQILVELEDHSVLAFNVENAALDCRQGMIAGNEIVIIYEGDCDLKKPETLNILKVADPVTPMEQRVRTATGKVTGATMNTITIRTAKNAYLTFTTTGTEQFYSQGLKKGLTVYVRFQGKFHKDKDGKLDTSNVKVLNISDLEEIPEPTPTPTPDPSLDEKDQLKFMTVTIAGMKNYTLYLRQNGSNKSMRVKLSQLTARLPYGLHTGSRAAISYTGIIKGTNLKKAQILSVAGEDLRRLPAAQQTASVSGTIKGMTANILTISTKDLAMLTFDLSGIPASDLPKMEYGDSVTITYNPSLSAETAMFGALELKIQKNI